MGYEQHYAALHFDPYHRIYPEYHPYTIFDRLGYWEKEERLRREKEAKEKTKRNRERKQEEARYLQYINPEFVWFCPRHNQSLKMTEMNFGSDKIEFGYCNKCKAFYCLPSSKMEGKELSKKPIKGAPKIKLL